LLGGGVKHTMVIIYMETREREGFQFFLEGANKKEYFYGFLLREVTGVYLTNMKRKSRRFSSFPCGSNGGSLVRLRRVTVPSALTTIIL
jgi:hypothetical protein